MNKKRIAVIGAGISGLTCAYNLQKAGFEVVVFEKNATVGGRMQSREKDGFLFDIGANHLVPLYTHMRKYVQQFGLEWYAFDDFGYGIFKDDEVKKPFDVISRMTKLKLFSSSLSGRKTSFDDFMFPVQISEYDTEDGDSYLRKKIGEEATNYLGDGFVSAYQFYGLKEVSKAFVLAGIESIQHDNKDWSLHLTRGGMSALPNAFAKELDVRLNTEVKQVEAKDDEVKIDGELFDAAVLASTASASKQMFKNPTQAQQELLDSISYASSMVVAFQFSVEHCTDETLVWTPKIESPMIASYSLEHTKGEAVIQNGKTLLLAFLHDKAARDLMNKTDEEIYVEVKKELLRVAPSIQNSDWLDPHDLQRWEEAMPTYPQGSIQHMKEFLDMHQGEQHVWLCGDYMSSPWTEGALRCGERVAEAISLKIKE